MKNEDNDPIQASIFFYALAICCVALIVVDLIAYLEVN